MTKKIKEKYPFVSSIPKIQIKPDGSYELRLNENAMFSGFIRDDFGLYFSIMADLKKLSEQYDQIAIKINNKHKEELKNYKNNK